MCEYASYEPLAEVYLTVTDDSYSDAVYCLCSRVVIRGDCNSEEQEGLGVVPLLNCTTGDTIYHTATPEGEGLIKFFNSSTESPPPQLKALKRKENQVGGQPVQQGVEEAVSCYCSASHCSTDEHDSIRESTSSALQSDSGADLSESSKDLDWEKYWAAHGQRLVWESWVAKYGDYIDPDYLGGRQPPPAILRVDDSLIEETLFNVTPSSEAQPKKTTFSGILDSINETSELGECEPLLIQSDDLRLSYCSQSSSGKSGSSPTTTTTDSMTSITHMTISSSELSFSLDGSSVKSAVSSGSSSSAESYEMQWQQLWSDHCDEQYRICYQQYTHKPSPPQQITPSTVEEEEDCFGCLEEDEENLMQLDDSTELNDLVNGEVLRVKRLRTRPKKKKTKIFSRKQTASVGYLLMSLNSLSVENDGYNVDEVLMTQDDRDISSITIPVFSIADVGCGGNSALTSKCTNCDEPLLVSDFVTACSTITTSPSDAKIQKQKLNTQNYALDADNSSLDRVKGAFTLMGFVFKPNGENKSTMDDNRQLKIKRAEVVYRKRNIRSHNRSLKMPTLPRHIYFNDDDNKQRNTLLDKVKRFLEDTDTKNPMVVDSGKSDEPSSCWNGFNEEAGEGVEDRIDAEDEVKDMARHHHRPDADIYSEKDDSSTDEDNSGGLYSGVDETGRAEDETKGQQQPPRGEAGMSRIQKKRRKRRLRKWNLPAEIVDNEKLLKYWYQRYRLFSKYDDGIKLDAESWYSVTPEKVSKHIAERCRCDVIVDAFCGAGGNAIQFAFTCERVIAVDIDAKKVELAKHNASVYGVADRIEFIVGDFLEVATRLAADVVFLSPPWGGPQYMLTEHYDLDCVPLGGQRIFQLAASITPNITYYLPKNFNTNDLVRLTGPGGSVEIEQNFLDKKLIALTAYFGELVESVSADY